MKAQDQTIDLNIFQFLKGGVADFEVNLRI